MTMHLLYIAAQVRAPGNAQICQRRICDEKLEGPHIKYKAILMYLYYSVHSSHSPTSAYC